MQNRKKRGGKELPVTGVLIAVVAVLFVCLAVVVWMVFQKENSGQRGEAEPNQQVLETGRTEIENESDISSKDETAKDETAKEDGNETESDEALKTEGAPENGAEPESGTEPENVTEPETGAESETETEAETEAAPKLVVAIDPGHQGSWVNMSDTEPDGPGSSQMKAKASTGTQGRFSGKNEYELNLEISLLLRDELERRGYEVILTREDHDTAISNSERALMAYDMGGDIYVRIHANGADSAGAQGALAMVPSPNNPYVGYLAEDSYLLAEHILGSYCNKASFQSLGIQYYDNMTGINWSKLPVMILEMGFMTNESDDLRMADPSVQPLMASGIADGIDAYFTEKGMKKKEISPAAAAKVNTMLEIAGEDCLFPAQDQGEEWAVSIMDLDSGASGDIGGDRVMKSASVIKAFLMAAVYDRVCYPSSEDRMIYFAESYEGELKQLLTDMITVSDNTAANTLLQKLGDGDAKAGMAVVNQFCEENGYTATRFERQFLEQNPSGDNVTSANDCRNLLASIYNGTCVNAEASAKMFEYLKNQTRTGKIPSGLLGTTAVAANKTGELAGDYNQYVENDIAVVEDGASAYVLCVLSNNLNDNGNAVARIAGLSGAVYEVWKAAENEQ